jgi:hypothetical protein
MPKEPETGESQIHPALFAQENIYGKFKRFPNNNGYEKVYVFRDHPFLFVFMDFLPKRFGQNGGRSEESSQIQGRRQWNCHKDRRNKSFIVRENTR